MSIPQGSLPFNTEVFAQLRARIDAVNTGDALQKVTDEAMTSINGVTGGITQQIAALQPILALLSPPSANPAQIVTWLTNFITAFLQPYAKPAITLPIQIAALSAEVAALTASIQAAAARLGDVDIEIPPINIPEFPVPEPDPDPPTP